MTKGNYKILACDLDGTLFYPKQRKTYISSKNLAFLRKFIDKGNKLVLVSSRSEFFVKKVIAEIDRQVDYIASTGAKISIDNNLIQNKHLNGDELSAILSEIQHDYRPVGYLASSEKFPLMIKAAREVNRFFMKLYAYWYRLYFGIYYESFIYDKDIFDKEVLSNEVFGAKIFFGLMPKKNKINKEINKQLREKYPEIESSWIGMAIELSPRGCNKADAIQTYVDYLNADKDDVYVIGDSGNDISMFLKFKEHSFVMKHAYPSVKKYAKYEISRVYKLDKYVFEKEQTNE
jgi:Cof subfamily protein (haloacid dehalogenase superfamily)